MSGDAGVKDMVVLFARRHIPLLGIPHSSVAPRCKAEHLAGDRDAF